MPWGPLWGRLSGGVFDRPRAFVPGNRCSACQTTSVAQALMPTLAFDTTGTSACATSAAG
jgi:hypothetical protein